MALTEKRKYIRIDSLHLLNYIHYGESEDDVTQGMGRTLNVSEAGILLETHTCLDSDRKISLTIGIEEDVVDINGNVVYCQQNEEGRFEAGIEFFVMDEAARNILCTYIQAFDARKTK